MNTEALVKQSLATTLHLENPMGIQSNAHLKRDLHLDSMSSLMFLMKLEENIHGFYVDPETLETKDLETVSSVVSYVNMQLKAGESHVH